MLQTRQPLGLEAEPRDRGLPITGFRIWGPNKQTNKQYRPEIFLGIFEFVNEIQIQETLEAHCIILHTEKFKRLNQILKVDENLIKY